MRRPAVAGQFYAGDPEGLRRQVEDSFTSPLGPGVIPRLMKKGPRRVVGGVSPHAGLMFSGMVAAHFYARLAEDGFPETFVIIGPNHSGSGSGIALLMDDFETPMGVAKVDRELASELCVGPVQDDPVAHYFEHSIEIQLPFIQYFTHDFKFVPISMAFQDYDGAKALGDSIRKAIAGRDAVVIASTDMSHYVAPSVAKEKDGLALERIRAMDARGLYDVVVDENISMCGYGPTIAMMTACAGGRAQVLKYATSGDVRPMDEVVGYASVVIEK